MNNGVFNKKTILLAGLIMLFTGFAYAEKQQVLPAPNGIEIPIGYKNWRLISVTHRTDNNSLRVILGNSAAIKAVQAGNTNPWPNGTILAKLVWKDRQLDTWPAATVPGDFNHAEFMFKDSKKYPETGGWGYARWKGLELIPYGKDASFVQECAHCHKAASKTDNAFTIPALLP
jgi:hypothetical protein